MAWSEGPGGSAPREAGVAARARRLDRSRKARSRVLVHRLIAQLGFVSMFLGLQWFLGIRPRLEGSRPGRVVAPPSRGTV